MTSVYKFREKEVNVNKEPLDLSKIRLGRWTMKVKAGKEFYWLCLLRTTRYAIVKVARYDRKYEYAKAPVYIVKPDAVLKKTHFVSASRLSNAQMIVKKHTELYFEKEDEMYD